MVKERSSITTGQPFGARVAKALGLEGTRRIIIDIPLEGAVIVYVEMYGTEKLYDIQWSDIGPCIIHTKDEQELPEKPDRLHIGIEGVE